VIRTQDEEEDEEAAAIFWANAVAASPKCCAPMGFPFIWRVSKEKARMEQNDIHSVNSIPFHSIQFNSIQSFIHSMQCNAIPGHF
jgi:hypothetical protein